MNSDDELEPSAEEEPSGEATEVAGAEDAEAVETEEPCGARLILKRSGTETDVSFSLGESATVGRFDPDVGPIDIDLGSIDEGIYVSRKHAQIELVDGAWKVRDLGSANGTFVLRDDFERVEEAELEDGTEIAFGNARFVFRV